jgi:hypothetical protein
MEDPQGTSLVNREQLDHKALWCRGLSKSPWGSQPWKFSLSDFSCIQSAWTVPDVDASVSQLVWESHVQVFTWIIGAIDCPLIIYSKWGWFKMKARELLHYNLNVSSVRRARENNIYSSPELKRKVYWPPQWPKFWLMVKLKWGLFSGCDVLLNLQLKWYSIHLYTFLICIYHPHLFLYLSSEF